MTAIASGEAALPAAKPESTDTLSRRVARLRTRGGQGDWDRWLLIVGGTLLPLGILVVILGWLGASHTVLLFEQVPYMISGGQLGQSLVFTGGFVYFAYWMTLLVRESRTRHEEMIASMSRLEAAIVGRQASPDTAAAETPTVASPASPGFVATRKGTMLHRRDCQVVSGRNDLRAVSPGSAGLEPCKLCQPDA